MFGSYWEVARQFFTSFCLDILVSLVGSVGVRLKLEVFLNSKLLKIGLILIFKPKVRVRLK